MIERVESAGVKELEAGIAYIYRKQNFYDEALCGARPYVSNLIRTGEDDAEQKSTVYLSLSFQLRYTVFLVFYSARAKPARRG